MQPGRPNVGLKLPAEQVGARLAELERHDPRIEGGVLDPSAFNSDGGPTIAQRITTGSGNAIFFRPADNARVPGRGAMGGWDQVRARLVGDAEGRAMMVFFSTCRDTIRTLPALQHDSARPEDVDTHGEGWVLNESWFGKIRIRGESTAGKTLFIGIGPQAEVARYLGDVAHANVQDVDFDPFRATYLLVSGSAPRAPPTAQTFWAASASGVGTQTLTWKVRDGDWSVVMMNADASRGVAAEVDLGAKLSFLLWVAIGLLIGGAFVVGGSAALAVLAARGQAPAPGPPAEGRAPDAAPPPESPPPDRPREEPPPG